MFAVDITDKTIKNINSVR